MKSNYCKGYKLPEYTQIFPVEAFTLNPLHDFAVYCCLFVNFGKMRIDELQTLSDWIYFRDPRINKQVVETCQKVVKEQLGYIWLQ